MYAVIMAGGEGSRLRPLTCEIPKPLAPLCGRPVVDYILDLLKKHGCDGAVLTLMYLADRLTSHFPDEEYKGIPLSFAYEDEPLGTAGSVKNAAKVNEDFLVISGDAMCDFDLTAAFAFHKQSKAAATLVVTRVEDPREYGLVQSGENGRITGFLEKPSRLNCVTGLANTGIYILSPAVLELIPDGKSSDFSFDIFPEMLRRKMPLYAYEAKGYWKDIGDIKSYIDCQRDMLEGKVDCEVRSVVRNAENVVNCPPGVEIHPPVYIGGNVSLGEGVTLGAGSVLCDNVSVGRGSKIRGGVLLPGVTVGSLCSVNQAVICEDAVLETGAGVFEYAVVGRHAVVSSRAFVHPRIKVWDYKTVPAGLELKGNLQQGDVREIICEENGIEGELGSVVTPQFCATLGSALASLKKNCIVGVGNDGSETAAALESAVLSGIAAAGAEGWRFGAGVAPKFRYCLSQGGCDFGVYLRLQNDHVSLCLSQDGGLPMTRVNERKLEGFLNRGEYKRAVSSEFGREVDFSGMGKLYEAHLVRKGGSLEGLSVRLKPPLSPSGRLLRRVLERLGVDVSSGPFFGLSADGTRLSVFDETTGFVPHERLIALVCAARFGRGEDVSVPNTLLAAVDELAERYRHRVYRYATCPCDRSDEQARTLAVAEPFVEDGLLLAVEVLRYLKESGQALAEALKAIPTFSTAVRRVEINEKISDIFERIGAVPSGIGEGVRLRDKRGELLLRPAKSGRGIFIYAESRDSETAEELCGFYEDLIKKGPLC